METCGLEVGVDGLELRDGLDLSTEGVLMAGWDLEGVVGLDTVGRAEAVEGLVLDERFVGVDGLM